MKPKRIISTHNGETFYECEFNINDGCDAPEDCECEGDCIKKLTTKEK
jgi:hypothetical protein